MTQNGCVGLPIPVRSEAALDRAEWPKGGGAAREEAEGEGEGGGGAAMLSRKDKRKAMKKEKRRLWRRERAEKVKEEELARLNDPSWRLRLKMMRRRRRWPGRGR
ncbi:hypothetical protein MLD38_039136 [Melastoma candidum]|uniref:Uncharacterized protein n=1 Tax=Melastoma candidum TaxID=119954 RepID=A0ACB9L147_9MYRT|nr:hypothetical protein MLD38_039136 [Melastoma candidum]